MLPSPPVERIELPTPTPPAPRPPFPWVATAAPVLVSVVLWLVTGSVFSLLFAALGPVVAVGGLVDGGRGRRRTARREEERLRDAGSRVAERIARAHDTERERLRSLVPRDGWDDTGPLAVRWGSGATTGVVQLTGDVDAFADLRDLAAVVPRAPLLIDAAHGVGVVGPTVLARAVARSLVVQLAGRLPPDSAILTAAQDETWAASLPHGLRTHDAQSFVWERPGVPDLLIAWASDRAGLPPGCPEVIDATAAHAVTLEQCAERAVDLTERAAALGRRPRGTGLPAELSLTAVLGHSTGIGMAAPIGRDDEGPVIVDLLSDGPHALVAGTTGSGKSELLVSWVLGIAHGRSPSEVTFLLIDFKGGAAFAPLAGLPHVLGTVSDLDARVTRRAVESLRAELLRREHVLARHGARAVEELPGGVLPRLVIVVDEFAALVAGSPELHDVFSDLAARGRSLGLHLILCTQRPAGVVRDAVLANIGLRISLRVADPADSVALLGDDSAVRIPPSARGRALIAGDRGPRAVQIALASAADAAAITAATPSAMGFRPWLDPLPPRLELDELSHAEFGPAERALAFGLLDLPGEQRQPVAAHDLRRDGHLLVLGTAGAGKTTLLTTLAESARRSGQHVHVLAPDPADAWAQLATPPRGGLLVLDDLDALLAAFDPDYRHEVLARLSALLRDPSADAPLTAVTARRLTGELAGLTSLFGTRVLLRQPSRDDHLVAGGAHDGWDPTLPPGAGTRNGIVLQVARAAGATLPPPRVPAPVQIGLASHPVLAIVAARPRALVGVLRESGARVIELGRDAPPDPHALHVTTAPQPTILIGDPDAWQAEWALLTTARREWPIVLTGCAPADHRALLRDRELPPLLGSTPGECWLAHDGITVRAVLDSRSETASARDSEG